MSAADLQDLSADWTQGEEVLVEKRTYAGSTRDPSTAMRRAIIVRKERAFATVDFLGKTGKKMGEIQKVPYKRLKKVPPPPITIQALTSGSKRTDTPPPPPPLRAVPTAFESIKPPKPVTSSNSNGAAPNHHSQTQLPITGSDTTPAATVAVSNVAPKIEGSVSDTQTKLKQSDLTAWLQMGETLVGQLRTKHAELTAQAEQLTKQAQELIDKANDCRHEAADLEAQINQYGPAIHTFSTGMLKNV